MLSQFSRLELSITNQNKRYNQIKHYLRDCSGIHYFFLSHFFKNRQMKATNQFDYPTGAATTFKAYKEQGLNNSNKDHQNHYKQVIKQSGDMERNKVKMNQQRKKEIQNQEQQSRIREEILKKKRELEELEKRKEEAIENQRRAAQLAKIKEEQDRIKMFEKQQKSKENQENAQFRFKEALRRLDAEREENAFQERWAQQRRRANQEAEKAGRQQAIKFKDWQREKQLQEKEMALEEEKREIEMMRNGLGRCGLNKAGLDYSKTCLHNPNMIFRSTQVGPTAFQRGQNEERRQQLLQEQKKEKQEQAKRRSLERGENALQRLSREREYQTYTRETEQQQIQYNLKRIEEGKRNQYVGMKPMTLAQMELNKKVRGQQEFENQFFGSQVAVHQDPASKYMIIQTKYPHSQSSRQFNESRESYPEFSIKQPDIQNYLQQQEEQEEQPQSLNVQPTRIIGKPMAETRAEDVKPHREDLYYSQSQEDSSYP